MDFITIHPVLTVGGSTAFVLFLLFVASTLDRLRNAQERLEALQYVLLDIKDLQKTVGYAYTPANKDWGVPEKPATGLMGRVEGLEKHLKLKMVPEAKVPAHYEKA